MESFKQYLLEGNNITIRNFDDLENDLQDFVDSSGLEDDGSNDIDEVITSFIEYLNEIVGVNKNIVTRIIKKYNSDIRKWFFDNYYTDEI